MRQPGRAAAIKSAIGLLLLLLLQAGAFAQSEDADSIIDMPSVVYEAEEQVPEQVAPVPDLPTFRSVPDSVISSFKRRKEFAYANDPSYWVRDKPDTSTSWIDWLIAQQWFRYLIVLLVVGILLFALIKIALTNRLFIFRGSRKSRRMEEEELLQKDNLAALILEAEEQKNFRLAVRYRYMKALQDMDHRQFIQLNAQSTNWDYVNRLGAHPFKKQFLLLTRAYEYVWYGEFNINQEQYGYLRTEFMQFENLLG